MVPIASNPILDSTSRKDKAAPKRVQPFQLLLRSGRSAYLHTGVRRVFGFETIERLEHLERLKTDF
jgi:hypothetical protein